MTEKNNDLLKGLFIGGLIGIALGILFAPKSGKETREDITHKANDVLSKAKDEYGKAVEKGKLVYESSLNNFKELSGLANEKVEDVENKDSELAYQGVEPNNSGKNIFKKAIDAGLEAYREESNKD